VNRFCALAAVLLLTPLCAVPGRAEDLKLLISVEQQSIVAPHPVRATLHFHNSGQQTLWLYRPVRSEMPGDRLGLLAPVPSGARPGEAYGGSQLEVRLAPQSSAGADAKESAGSGFAMAPDAFPYPRLVRLAPGEDYQEKVSIHVESAQTKAGAGDQPAWGPYSFSVIYSAGYSNSEALARDINAHLWHGQATSNTVTLQLRPPAGQGSIAGTALDSIGRPYGQALVTLEDENESPLDQLLTDDDGRFAFAHLPLGRYWLAVRQPGADHDTSVFRHVDVTEAGTPATAEIMLVPVEINKPDRLLHKPVLFHIVDSKGLPLAEAGIAILYSAETVVENLKAQTGRDGFTAVSLIPGSIYVTLQTRGCKKEDRQAGVAPGPGVDGFKFTYDCAGN
jgi:Carboxypeptidase regulatory-like domain